MEEICSSTPHSSKHNGYRNRTRDYIRIYSASRRKSNNSVQRSFKTDQETVITNQLNSSNLSKANLSTPLYTLQNLTKSLLYDIQKATSDKFELIRDLSGYDNSFSKEIGLKETLANINQISMGIPKSIDIIDSITSEENTRYLSLVSGLQEMSSLKPNKILEPEPALENFCLKRKSLAQIMTTVYKGVAVISGVYCTVSLVSDKWLENLNFHVTTLDNQIYSTHITQNMSNLYTSEEMKATIKNKLLKMLTFRIENDQVRLVFDNEQGSKYYCLICKIKGYKMCNVIITCKAETKILVEVPLLEQSILVDFPNSIVEIINKPKSLARLVLAKLVYLEKSNCLLWDFNENCFDLYEKNSKFFDEAYLERLIDMGKFKELYSFYNEKYKVDITCLENNEKVVLKAVKGKKSYDVNLSFLTQFQDINIKNSQKTLRSSLELNILLSKLFSKAHY